MREREIPEAGSGAERATRPDASESLGSYRIFRPILFALDPERAHQVTLAGMEAASRMGILRPLAGASVATIDAIPPVRVMGLDFPNPVGLAAGLDKDGRHVGAFGDLGFGFIEIGTLTPRPQPGNPRPRLFRLPAAGAVINRMGFNNCGAEQGAANASRRGRFRGVLGINIGKNADTPLERAADDYIAGMRAVWNAADYIAVNFSSPNTKGLRDLQALGPARVLITRLREEQESLHASTGRRVPLAIKIAPDLEDDAVCALGRLFAELGVGAVIAANTTVARDRVKGLPNAHQAGGLSGAPLAERATETVRILADELQGRVPIIGVGGIMSAADAVARLDAGASLVQLYTGLIYRGPKLLGEILQALARHSR